MDEIIEELINKLMEGTVLFNDVLNTFYLWLYGIRYRVKDHIDNERGNPLPQHGLLFPINSKGSFICIIPQTGEHIPWLEREIGPDEFYIKGSSEYKLMSSNLTNIPPVSTYVSSVAQR